MRQRKLKNLDERLAAYREFILDAEDIGNFLSSKGRRGVFLEIGCGKGRFINELAKQNPSNLYIGIEGNESVVLRALEKAGKEPLDNLKFMIRYVNNLLEIFPENSASGIYLNFSDPWLKNRHAGRRLTHTRFLKIYMKVIKPGGFVAFKTDNDSFFEFSVEEIKKNRYEIEEFTRDLHNSRYNSDNIMTEYEEKFLKAGKKINYVKIRPRK